LKKKRLIEEGYNLDLTYITRNIIAMGYPAQGIEGKYRNPIEKVNSYLLKKHYTDLKKESLDKPQKIKIYNLCIEKNK
jgi:phosphatidylinositol-3,4,5-trisphosphate 3-phosphatase/dual-specificity protein phosphatase PTEN